MSWDVLLLRSALLKDTRKLIPGWARRSGCAVDF